MTEPGRRVAIVTGANHGIGAATARAFAARGDAVLISYLRIADEPDPGVPEQYRHNRAQSAQVVLDEIAASGGRAIAIESDLADPATARRLFDEAQRAFGPVDVLVNNATGWRQDTFQPARVDQFGRTMQPVTTETFDGQFAIDARVTALLIAEFARRHVERGGDWGRIVGLTTDSGPEFADDPSLANEGILSDILREWYEEVSSI